jgi:hypothetical protein
MTDLAPVTFRDRVVARCVRCGREFVTLPAGKIMIDPYPPQGSMPRGDFIACLGRLEPTLGEEKSR